MPQTANRLITLHLLVRNKPHKFGKHIMTDDRQCFKCGSHTTTISDNKVAHWYHLPNDKLNWYCKNCYPKLTYRLALAQLRK